MPKDNLVGSSSRRSRQRGSISSRAVCLHRQKTSDDMPPCLEDPLSKGGIYTNGKRFVSISG
jgi:hypothetical protein